jgi:hypothetical protein
MNDYTKNLADFIFDSMQFLVILTSALWAYFRFRRENPLHPRIEFDLDCNFLGPQANSYLSSFIITANNKGNVEHKFSEIRLRVLGIKKNQPFTEFEKYSPMVNFPEEIMKEINIVPPKFEYFFVRPNVNQSFSYITQIKADIRFIVVRATFKYQSTEEIHTTQKVFEVK